MSDKGNYDRETIRHRRYTRSCTWPASDVPIAREDVFVGIAKVRTSEKPREVEVIEIQSGSISKTVLKGLGLVGALAGTACVSVLLGMGMNKPAAPSGEPFRSPTIAGSGESPSATPSANASPSTSPTPPPAVRATPTVGNPAPAPEQTVPEPTTIEQTTTEPVPSYVGEIIQAPNGEYYYVGTDGNKHLVPNGSVLTCIQVRRGTGPTISVPAGTIGAIPTGLTAYCPYGINGTGTINFVTESGSGGWVWLVTPDGRKFHVGGLCPPEFQGYAYEVHQVPAGETAGHQNVGDWFGNSDTCAALPS